MNITNKEDKYFYILCKSSEVSNKLTRYDFQNKSIVIFRDQNGLCHCFLDFCPHRGVPLSEGKLENDQIICSYHGWRFNSNGSCVEIPSLKKPHNSCLKSLNLIEKDGFIFLSFSKNTSFEEIPSITISNYDRFYWKYEIQGDLIDLIENFLDATHTPFIHNFLIRSNKAPKLIQAELERMNEMVRITYKGESSQQGLISKIFEKKRTYSDAVFQMPNVSEINYYNSSGLNLKIKIFLTQIKDKNYQAHIFFYLKKSFFNKIKYFFAYPFFYFALKQDLRILKSQFKNKSIFQDKSYVINPECDLIRPHLHDLMINGNFEKKIKKSFQIYV